MGWTSSCSRKTLHCGSPCPLSSFADHWYNHFHVNRWQFSTRVYAVLGINQKEDQGFFKFLWTSCLTCYWTHRERERQRGWKFALPSLEIRKPIPQCTSWGHSPTGCTVAENLAPATTGWLLLTTRQEKCDLDIHLESPSSIYWRTQWLTLVKDCCTFHRRAQNHQKIKFK